MMRDHVTGPVRVYSNESMQSCNAVPCHETGIDVRVKKSQSERKNKNSEPIFSLLNMLMPPPPPPGRLPILILSRKDESVPPPSLKLPQPLLCSFRHDTYPPARKPGAEYRVD